MDNLVAEVPLMAKGLFLSISKNEKSNIKTSNHKADDIEEQAIESTIEKICKCGRRATTYDFGEIENGKFDWTFYCNTCSPHKEIAGSAKKEQITEKERLRLRKISGLAHYKKQNTAQILA